MPDAAPSIVITQKAYRRNAWCGLAVLLFFGVPALTLLRNDDPTTGTIVVMVVFAVIGVVVVLVWVQLRAHPTRFVITTDEIRHERGDGTLASPALEKVRGDRIGFEVRGINRSAHQVLTNTSGDPAIPLTFFQRDELEAAYLSMGWRTGGASDVERLVTVLDEVIARVGDPEADVSWASFATPELAIAELANVRDALQAGDTSAAGGLVAWFAPTGPVHEVAIHNGWGDRFLELSQEVDLARANLVGFSER